MQPWNFPDGFIVANRCPPVKPGDAVGEADGMQQRETAGDRCCLRRLQDQKSLSTADSSVQRNCTVSAPNFQSLGQVLSIQSSGSPSGCGWLAMA